MRATLSPILQYGFAAALLAGCRSTESSPEPAPPPAEVEAVPWQVGGVSAEGRPIEYAVFGSGLDTVLLIAGIHGNEESGTPLLMHLARSIARASEPPPWLRGRRVVVLPSANPDGLAAGRRRNARGVDLNRNFPSENFRAGRGGGTTPLCEPESRAIQQLFERFPPDRILSFHMPIGVLDHDGPADGLARAMGEVSPLPVRRIGSRPGSLGSWAGVDLGLPIVTVELPASARDLDVEGLWTAYGPMLLAAIEYSD